MALLLMALLIPLCLAAPRGLAVFDDTLTKEDLANVMGDICRLRNQAILSGNLTALHAMYDTTVRNGIYAYDHEEKRALYLANWSDKQGIRFIDISSTVVIRWFKKSKTGYTVNMLISTSYSYAYLDQPGTINTMRIGTYHETDLVVQDQRWIITKDWYTDPFADSLDLETLKTDEIQTVILAGEQRDFSDMNEGRRAAVDYANRYVGAADSGENGYSYNPAYKDYNAVGGDCANFVSQVLYEGGGFKKNATWTYGKDGSLAWVKARNLKNYLLYSGRGSLIIYGDYKDVLNLSYKLLPGDVIAYERSGKVTHVSVVTGVDSRGYAVVNCHNTDRSGVPWDLGWSDSKIRFYLIRINY